MMTVITTMELQPGAQEDWEELIQERFRSAHGRNGWVAGQLLSPSESPDLRVIVGTWRSKADWQSWHEEPAFLESRARLDALQTSGHQTLWYHVIDDARA
ncbi:MAG: antibiotic biosynthesis monooxygenase family protein [Marmoricola sp.]